MKSTRLHFQDSISTSSIFFCNRMIHSQRHSLSSWSKRISSTFDSTGVGPKISKKQRLKERMSKRLRVLSLKYRTFQDKFFSIFGGSRTHFSLLLSLTWLTKNPFLNLWLVEISIDEGHICRNRLRNRVTSVVNVYQRGSNFLWTFLDV